MDTTTTRRLVYSLITVVLSVLCKVTSHSCVSEHYLYVRWSFITSRMYLRCTYVAITGRVDCTSWEVDNKYYGATLEFEVCGPEKDLSEDCQAVAILYDFRQVSRMVCSLG